MTCPAGPPPTIWIKLPFEGKPSVRLTAALAPGDEARLLAWLRGNPRLLDLVGEAIELQDAEVLT
jgi:hypothetical protein